MRTQPQNSKANTPDFKQIIEIYLFINPLGSKCYQAEKELLTFIESKSDKKVHFRFIPFHNLQTVSNYMKFHQLPERNLALRNEICGNTYSACLAYKAALMQGKKKGRTFLMNLQKAVVEDQCVFSETLLKTIAQQSHLDVEMFLEDKQSDFAKKDYEKDQQIAREMNIQCTPSLVLFDNLTDDYGLLLDNECISLDLVTKLCDSSNSIRDNHKKIMSQNTLVTKTTENHLRVLGS